MVVATPAAAEGGWGLFCVECSPVTLSSGRVRVSDEVSDEELPRAPASDVSKFKCEIINKYV